MAISVYRGRTRPTTKNDVEQHGDHTPPNGSTVECIPFYSVHFLCWTTVLSSIDIRQVKVSATDWLCITT